MISSIRSNSGLLSIVIQHRIHTDDGASKLQAKSYTISPDHPHYHGILVAVREEDEAAIEKLANISGAIEDYAEGNIEVKSGVVCYNGIEVHNSITERILSMMRENFDHKPLCRFLDNLFQNPSRRAINELYSFLVRTEHYQPLPITEDGHFLAYKSVDDNYKDWFSRQVDNTPREDTGEDAWISCNRNEVDDDFGVNCSDGYHVGSLAYVSTFYKDAGHKVIVKINPRDVVSVPSDESCTKCRVCRYLPFADYEGELPNLVYDARGQDSVSLRLPSSMVMINSNGNGNSGRSDSDPFDTSPSPFDVYGLVNDYEDEEEDDYEYDEEEEEEDDNTWN